MLHYMRALIVSRTKTERGATATEYGLLVAFIAIAIILGVTAFGGALDSFFDRLKVKVDGWAP